MCILSTSKQCARLDVHIKRIHCVGSAVHAAAGGDARIVFTALVQIPSPGIQQPINRCLMYVVLLIGNKVHRP